MTTDDTSEWLSGVRDEFAEYDLGEYALPTFTDGVSIYEVFDRLESEHDLAVRFVGYNVDYGDDWTVEVNGEPIGEIPRTRTNDHGTQYLVTSEEFISCVLNAYY